MPSCHGSLRTLRRSCCFLSPKQNSVRLPRWQRLASTSSTNTTNNAGSPTDKIPLDLHKVTAESSYLDFLLGPSDDVQPVRKRPVRNERTTDTVDEPDEQNAPSFTWSSRRQTRTGRMVPVSPANVAHAHSHMSSIHRPAAISGPRVSHNRPSRRVVVPKTKTTPALASRPKASINRAGRKERIVIDKRVDGKHLQPHRADGFSRWISTVIELTKCAKENREAKPPTLPHHTFQLVDRVYEALEQDPPLQQLDFLDNRNFAHWPLVALWFMHYDPGTALDLLIRTNHYPRPLLWYMRCTLQFLTTKYHATNDLSNLRRLGSNFQYLTSPRYPGGPPLFVHGAVYRILSVHSNEVTLSAFYSDLKKYHHRKVNWRTWLQLASSFSKRDRGNQALDALLEAKAAGGDIDRIEIRKMCSVLLRKAVTMPGGLRACIRMTDSMFKLGFTLDNNLANIIMLNAVESDDLKTAMDIYHSLRDHGLRPDAYTFGILLKACKKSIDNAEMLNETIREAIAGINVLESPIVATEILHCLALHHLRHHPENAFNIVADAYAQLFSLAPPRLVGLLPEKLSKIDETSHRPQPRSQDLLILLAMYIEQVRKESRTLTPIYDVWQRFKHAVETDQEPFSSMVQTDHVFNAFLGAFISTKKGLLHAAEVIKYMQLPDEPSARYARARPTVQTWSIFLHGFTIHKQLHLAEQVLTYMRSKDIFPNDVTYNTLLSGYARAQDLEGVLDTIRRLETDGFTWDSWTVANLKRFRDRPALEAAMTKRTDVALDFTDDLKRNLETRLDTFAPKAAIARKEGHVDGTVVEGASAPLEGTAPGDRQLKMGRVYVS